MTYNSEQRTKVVGESSGVKAELAAYVAPTAALYGHVFLSKGSSIWPNVVIRAEVNEVEIGRFTNIQDFVMIHIGISQGVKVGDYCSITHHVTLHGCTIADHCLIGIGATVMDGCMIGRGSIVAGHAFLKEGTIVPPDSIVMGAPAKVIKKRDSTRANILNALLYHHNALAYARGEHRAWDNLDLAAIEAEVEAIASQIHGELPLSDG